MLTGKNGILTQAQNAKRETEQAQANETNILSNYEDYIYETTGDVPQVNDGNPGVLEGSGTEQDPFVINSIEDLVTFADSVTNGNTYQEEHVKLNQSLDFKSDKSYVNPNRENYYGYTGKLKEALTTGEGFKPIGTTIKKENKIDTTNSFCGVFDGNEKQIINCYMNKDTSDLETINRFSLFGASTFGEIKNLGLTKVNFTLVSNEHNFGISGLSGDLNGKIVNCYVTGDIVATQKGNGDIYCTGIALFNKGTIENSFNLANINLSMTSESNSHPGYCAGVVSNNEGEEAIIRNCYNAGNIAAEIIFGDFLHIGGIVRYQDLGKIENCYNKGNIICKISENIIGYCQIGGVIGVLNSGTTNNLYNSGNISILTENEEDGIGGIVGENRGEVVCSYNIGTISNINENAKCYIGEAFGRAIETAKSSNLFYINSQPIGINYSSSCNTSKVSSDDLKGDNVLNILNQNETVWKKDTLNVNDGYPIFTWQ